MSDDGPAPFQPGCRVRDCATGQTGTVHTYIVTTGAMLVLPDGGLLTISTVELWEDEADPYVVETVPLARVLEEFVTKWRKTRPSTAGQWGSDNRGPNHVEPLSAFEYLHERGVTDYQIRKVRAPDKFPHTELRVADSLVAAIGMPEMFYDGTLNIAPNPAATATSLTGSGEPEAA